MTKSSLPSALKSPALQIRLPKHHEGPHWVAALKPLPLEVAIQTVPSACTTATSSFLSPLKSPTMHCSLPAHSEPTAQFADHASIAHAAETSGASGMASGYPPSKNGL